MPITTSPGSAAGPLPAADAAMVAPAAPAWLPELTTLRFSAALVRHGLPGQVSRALTSMYQAFGWELDDLLSEAAWARSVPAQSEGMRTLQVADDGTLTTPAGALVFAISDEPKVFYLCLPGASQRSSLYAAVMVDGYDEEGHIAQVHASEWMAWEEFNPLYVDYIAHS